MEKLIIIYIVGFFANYVMIKLFVREEHDNSWRDVLLTIFFSVFWPVFIMLFALSFVYDLLRDCEPPKWL